MKKHSNFSKNTSTVKCHAGNWGNVNLHFVHHKLYDELFFFSLPKTVNLSVFYSKITLNVPLDISQLFTVYSKEPFWYCFAL